MPLQSCRPFALRMKHARLVEAAKVVLCMTTRNVRAARGLLGAELLALVAAFGPARALMPACFERLLFAALRKFMQSTFWQQCVKMAEADARRRGHAPLRSFTNAAQAVHPKVAKPAARANAEPNHTHGD